MKKPPCYGCTDRSAECHAKCEAYGDWRREKDIQNRQIFEEKDREASWVGYEIRKGERLNRRK